MDWNKLKEPFPENDIEWRLARSGEKNGKIWAKCLAYVTNRAIMDRLDDVVGVDNWQNDFIEFDGGFVCTIRIWNGERWISKTDGAERTHIESFKGGLSGAMKRAAVQWGIGRYLYNLEEGWADVHPGGNYSGKTPDNKWFKWSPPQLPKWAVPEGDVPKKYHVPEKPATEAGQLTPRQVAINRLAGLVETWSEKGKADIRERVHRLDLQGLYDLIVDIEQDIVRDDML